MTYTIQGFLRITTEVSGMFREHVEECIMKKPNEKDAHHAQGVVYEKPRMATIVLENRDVITDSCTTDTSCLIEIA